VNANKERRSRVERGIKKRKECPQEEEKVLMPAARAEEFFGQSPDRTTRYLYSSGGYRVKEFVHTLFIQGRVFEHAPSLEHYRACAIVAAHGSRQNVACAIVFSW
jgi:hypothetical protein